MAGLGTGPRTPGHSRAATNGVTRPPQRETVAQADAAGSHSGCTNPHAASGALGSQASQLCQPGGADVWPAMPGHQGCLPESSPSVSGTFFLLTCRCSLYIYTQDRAHCHVLSLTSSVSLLLWLQTSLSTFNQTRGGDLASCAERMLAQHQDPEPCRAPGAPTPPRGRG